VVYWLDTMRRISRPNGAFPRLEAIELLGAGVLPLVQRELGLLLAPHPKF
jgi:hypothetical protein